MAVSCYNKISWMRNQRLEEKGAVKSRQMRDTENTSSSRVAIVKPLGMHPQDLQHQQHKVAAPKLADSKGLIARPPLAAVNKPLAAVNKPLLKVQNGEKQLIEKKCDPQGSKAVASQTTLAISVTNDTIAAASVVRQEEKEYKQKQPVLSVPEVEAQSQIPDLLMAVKQVDESEEDNPFYCSEYAEDIFQYMKHSEQLDCYSIPRDYLSRQPVVNGYNRAVLVDWLVQVHSKFCLLQETLHITIDTLDRFLKANRIEKRHLQLVGITSMYLASKYEEIYPPCISDFTFISADTYSSKQIREMERTILGSLDYRLNKPFSLQFLRRYSKITNSSTLEHSMAKFILEKAMMDCNLVSVRPSLRAAAALVLACQILNSKHTKEVKELLEKYTDFTEGEVLEVKRRLKVNLTVPLHTTVLKSIVQKYATKEFMEVAKHSGVRATTKK